GRRGGRPHMTPWMQIRLWYRKASSTQRLGAFTAIGIVVSLLVASIAIAPSDSKSHEAAVAATAGGAGDSASGVQGGSAGGVGGASVGSPALSSGAGGTSVAGVGGRGTAASGASGQAAAGSTALTAS